MKLLDFGLAKLTERVSGEFGETQTLAVEEEAKTAEGMIVGTVAYMSPEQAEGKPVDERSDVFAFGAVLYEMATGVRAFQRDSPASTLSAILNEQPKPSGLAVSSVPRDLEKIIARCLRKDPSRRFQHSADLKVALAELKEDSESGTLEAQTGGAHPPLRRRAPAVWISAGIGALVLLSLGVWAWRGGAGSEPDPKVVPLTTYPNNEFSPSFSPDGNQVAFAWNVSESVFKNTNYDIYLKLIGSGDRVQLTRDPADEFSPAWSPDGRFIAFVRMLSRERAGVFIIPAIGGRERKITEIHGSEEFLHPYFRYLAWFPDGRSLVIVDASSPGDVPALFRLSIDTGQRTRLTDPPRNVLGDEGPALSPDGRSVAFVRDEAENSSDLFLLELAGDLRPKGEPARLTSDHRFTSGPAWTPDGRRIVYASGAIQSPVLWEIPVRRLPWQSGSPHRLAVGAEGAHLPAISRQGRLAYASWSLDIDVWKLDLNGERPVPVPTGPLISSTRIEHEARYSTDGKRIAFVSNRSGSFEIWVCNADGSNLTQLTSFADFYYVSGPVWSPDGRLIYFIYRSQGKSVPYVIDSDGGTAIRVNLDDGEIGAVSHDGKWLYFVSKRSGADQIWKVAAAGGNPVQLTSSGGSSPLESDDGHYLYFERSGATGKIELWKKQLDSGEETRVLDSVLNDNFAVLEHGIYFIADSKPFTIQYLGFESGKPTTIASLPREPDYGFSVSPDRRSLLYADFRNATSDLMLVEHFR